MLCKIPKGREKVSQIEEQLQQTGTVLSIRDVGVVSQECRFLMLCRWHQFLPQ